MPKNNIQGIPMGPHPQDFELLCIYIAKTPRSEKSEFKVFSEFKARFFEDGLEKIFYKLF